VSELRPSRRELANGVAVPVGQATRVVIGWGVLFVRSDAGGVRSPAAFTAPIAAGVLGRLHRWGQRPADEDLVELEVPSGADRVELRCDGRSVAVPLAGKRSQKKLAFWYGAASDLGGATWGDIQLVEASASGAVPFTPIVEAHAQRGADRDEGRLGLVDILAEDPDAGGRLRSLRFGVFRTRAPRLTFVLPNLGVDVAELDVFLDDGDDDTDDELNLTARVALAGTVTTVALPGWVELDRGNVGGSTNEAGRGRNRLVVEDVERPPDEGSCALFLFGGNRVRVEDRGRRIVSASSLHYLDRALPVPPGHEAPIEVSEGGVTLTVARSSFTLDIRDQLGDAALSDLLAALRLAPRAYWSERKIVTARALAPLDAAAMRQRRDELRGLGDPDLTDVVFAALLAIGEPRTERVPQALHGDYVPATHTFANADHHWHHFVIHTFAAHRLIEAQILPQRPPPVSALGGANFDTRKTFILPGAAGDLRHILRTIDEHADLKVAIFGHTDRVGGTAPNEGLSLVRGQAMNALLRHQVGWWFDRFNERSEVVADHRRELKLALHETGDFTGAIDDADTPDFHTALDAFKARVGLGGAGATLATRRALGAAVRTAIGATGAVLVDESAWGTLEVQHMLKQLGHFAGTPTGAMTAAARDALEAFQRSAGLTDDGDLGLCSRVALIRAYQGALVATAVPDARFHAGAVFGCGEAFPAIATADEVPAAANRRVEALLRRSAVEPIDPTRRGAQVPYLDWRAPEADTTQAGPPPSIVVAVTDTGFGGGAAENFTGEQLTQPNHLFIKGERWIKPTSTNGASAANPNLAVITPDGDLRQVNDAIVGLPGGGHGSAVAICLGGDGIGAPIGGVARGPRNSVLGTAPHVKVRPIQISAAGGGANFFSYMLALKIIADDPDVLVYTTSVGAFDSALTYSAQQRRALQERAQEITMRGKLIFAIPQNYNPGFLGRYHSSRTQWGSISATRATSRATLTGANEFQKNLSIVGASDRVGSGAAPISAPTSAPGQFETGTGFTYVGEQVWVHMPGRQIRSLIPTAAGLAGGLGNPTPAGTDTIGGIDGTSFATPMTAGVAAELILLDPALRQPANITRVTEYLHATADRLPRLVAAAGGFDGTQRVADPLIAGNANHAAFFSIVRVNYWKAVLAALNQGLSNEGRGAAGAADAFHQLCTLRDDAATIWYGFELRVPVADAVVWLQRPDGSFVLAEDAGALMPGNRTSASAWRSVDTYQQLSAPGALAPGGPATALPIPAFPWPAGAFVGGRRQFFLCELSIRKDELARFQALVIHLPGTDPRGEAGRTVPPLLALRVDNRAALRVPAGAGGAIQAFVQAFDNFVFHVTVAPGPVDHYVLVPHGGQRATSAGVAIEIQIFAVDAFGNLTDPGAPATGTLSHAGTAGAAPTTGVFFNAAAAPQAGLAVTRAAPDPNGVIRVQFLDHAVEPVTLTFSDTGGRTGNLAMTVSAAGAVASFRVTVQRRGGGADVLASPPLAGELLEAVVTALDAQGQTATGFTGRVQLSVAVGQPGADGPPHPVGLHVATAVGDPFSADAFHHDYVAGDAGAHTFPLIAYSAGDLQLHAAGGGGQGDSPQLRVIADQLATLLVQAQTPQTAGTSFPVTVSAIDRFDNHVERFAGAVTLSVAAGTAGALGPPRAGVFIGDTSIPGDDSHTYGASDAGTHRFQVTAYTAENVTLRASHAPAVGPAIQGTSPAIVVQGAGALHHFRFELRGADRAGSAFECKVIAEDAGNRRIPGFAGTVALTVARGTAFAAAGPTGVQLAGTPHTYVAADNGEFTFTVTPHTAEQIQLQAASGGITSQSAVLTITGGALARFSVVPIAPRRNTPFVVQVTAQDASRNPIRDFLGVVTLSITVGGVRSAIAGATHSFVRADAGVFNFTVTLPQAGAGQIIDADDTNLRSTSAPFTLV